MAANEQLIKWQPANWSTRAACKGHNTDAFFFQRGGHAAAALKAAKAVCEICPVKTDCLDYALDINERNGVWGGMSDRERVLEKRRRLLDV